MTILLNMTTRLFYCPSNMEEALEGAKVFAKAGHKVKIITNAKVSYSFN